MLGMYCYNSLNWVIFGQPKSNYLRAKLKSYMSSSLAGDRYQSNDTPSKSPCIPRPMFRTKLSCVTSDEKSWLCRIISFKMGDKDSSKSPVASLPSSRFIVKFPSDVRPEGIGSFCPTGARTFSAKTPRVLMNPDNEPWSMPCRLRDCSFLATLRRTRGGSGSEPETLMAVSDSDLWGSLVWLGVLGLCLWYDVEVVPTEPSDSVARGKGIILVVTVSIVGKFRPTTMLSKSTNLPYLI